MQIKNYFIRILKSTAFEDSFLLIGNTTEFRNTSIPYDITEEDLILKDESISSEIAKDLQSRQSTLVDIEDLESAAFYLLITIGDELDRRGLYVEFEKCYQAIMESNQSVRIALQLIGDDLTFRLLTGSDFGQPNVIGYSNQINRNEFKISFPSEKYKNELFQGFWQKFEEGQRNGGHIRSIVYPSLNVIEKV